VTEPPTTPWEFRWPLTVACVLYSRRLSTVEPALFQQFRLYSGDERYIIQYNRPEKNIYTLRKIYIK